MATNFGTWRKEVNIEEEEIVLMKN